jgi:peptide/nickel transport system ATP-binding protein
MIPIPGNPPSLLAPADGCSFQPRCSHSSKVPGDLCRTVLPELTFATHGSRHLKRCHLVDPESIYEAAVLPQIAPDLVELLEES